MARNGIHADAGDDEYPGRPESKSHHSSIGQRDPLPEPVAGQTNPGFVSRDERRLANNRKRYESLDSRRDSGRHALYAYDVPGRDQPDSYFKYVRVAAICGLFPALLPQRDAPA